MIPNPLQGQALVAEGEIASPGCFHLAAKHEAPIGQAIVDASRYHGGALGDRLLHDARQIVSGVQRAALCVSLSTALGGERLVPREATYGDTR